MKLKLFSKKTVLILGTIFYCSSFAYAERAETLLSGDGWRLWLDKNATWKNDTIYMPPVNLSEIPVNIPTCGWDELKDNCDRIVKVPGTVEEYFWSRNGNPVGISGDYRGVSWWSKNFTVGTELKNKRITLLFDSVNLRAEIFINHKLVGYDVIGNTPFEVDITDAVAFGAENSLDVRITDPCGNFDWNDNELYRWGKNKVPGIHGFGGITGKIHLRATDAVHIDDIYVQNKPKITDADVFLTIVNSSSSDIKGTLTLSVAEWKNPSNKVFEKKMKVTISKNSQTISIPVSAPKAKPWNIKDSHLYTASAKFVSDNTEINDTAEKRFGFRWFDIGEKNGDKRFYLNGKRVFIFAAMTRGFWPKNGIFPTEEMALKDVEMTIKLGFNMMLFHRAIGQNYVTEVCDEKGILTYEEPGGYRCMPEPDETAKIWRKEKLRRMIIRDRSYPSMIIYNLKNEATAPPTEDDIRNVKFAHEIDPSRIITYNSDFNRTVKPAETVKEDPFKLHMKPFDNKLYYYGWWDQHHWNPVAGYIDEYYRNPRFFLRSSIVDFDSTKSYNQDEIIFWGEEGAFGTQLSLGKVKEELDRTGATGWRELEHLDFYDAYDRFLDGSGFRKSYPTVDALTQSLGINMHYFHGRILENVRLSNVGDAYNLNGWASEATHTDIVDPYRNSTADTSILSYYAQPLYIAVKVRDKSIPAGYKPAADFFIINEMNVKGKHKLDVKLESPDNSVIFIKSFDVNVTGGEEFGQLLIEGVSLPELKNAGYYRLNAVLKKNSDEIAAGHDDIFVIDTKPSCTLKGTGAVIDSSGVISKFIKNNYGLDFGNFDTDGPDLDYIIVGPHDPAKFAWNGYRAVMDRVASGATLIVMDNAGKWAEMMDNIYVYQAVRYINEFNFGNSGRFFTGQSRFLDGLPKGQAMGWEYQAFYRNSTRGIGMDIKGNELIVGVAAQHRKELLSALIRVSFGNGQIFLSTLDIVPGLSSSKPQTAAAKKLFMNIIEKSK